MDSLSRITQRVNLHGDPNDPTNPRALLTLAEFFEGNTAVGSICCNLIPTPMPDEVYKALRAILARPDVADVRVQITSFDDIRWPFSDTVWVITMSRPDEVMGWFPEGLRPDQCTLGWTEGLVFERCRVPVGMHPVACWWD